jgi:hypothetical protein
MTNLIDRVRVERLQLHETNLDRDVSTIQEIEGVPGQGPPVVMSVKTVECNKAGLECERSSGLIPRHPVGCNTEVRLTFLIRPDVRRETDSTGCGLFSRSLAV